MKASQRRDTIITELRSASEPVSGGEFAKRLGVSRQVIVQDISILRAQVWSK